MSAKCIGQIQYQQPASVALAWAMYYSPVKVNVGPYTVRVRHNRHKYLFKVYTLNMNNSNERPSVVTKHTSLAT